MNDSVNTPDLYIWLGLPSTGRRALMYDTAHASKDTNISTLFVISEEEPPTEFDQSLENIPNSSVVRYSLESGQFVFNDFPAETPDRIFWLLQGNENPIDQLEALKSWLEEKRWILTRIISVVSARMLDQHPKLKIYYEACVYYSDMVLLNQREGVPPDWSQKFTARYEKERYPCLFESVRNNRVKNPAVLLDPMPRRLSQYFDSLEDLASQEQHGGFDWIEEDDESMEEDDIETPTDPYMERNLGGDRKIKLPNLRELF
jgi:hypothetical protein